MPGDRSCRNSLAAASRRRANAIAVAAGAAANFQHALRPALDRSMSTISSRTRLLVLVKSGKLPIQGRIVDVLGDAVVLDLGLGFDGAEFGRPQQVRHAVLDGKPTALGRDEAWLSSSCNGAWVPESGSIESWKESSIFFHRRLMTHDGPYVLFDTPEIVPARADRKVFEGR